MGLAPRTPSTTAGAHEVVVVVGDFLSVGTRRRIVIDGLLGSGAHVSVKGCHVRVSLAPRAALAVISSCDDVVVVGDLLGVLARCTVVIDRRLGSSAHVSVEGRHARGHEREVGVDSTTALILVLRLARRVQEFGRPRS